MAVILSTVDTIGVLTGNIHRALNNSFSLMTDYIIDNYGGELAGTQVGRNINIASGLIVLNGTVIENTNTTELLFNIVGTGQAMVIVKVDLNTKTSTIEIKDGLTLTQNDLISNPVGIREYELYRITYTSSLITGFVDKRTLFQKPYNINILTQASYDAISPKDANTIYMILN